MGHTVSQFLNKPYAYLPTHVLSFVLYGKKWNVLPAMRLYLSAEKHCIAWWEGKSRENQQKEREKKKKKLGKETTTTTTTRERA